MVSFATEFPVKRVPRGAAFVAEVIGWLRGTNYSTVLESPHADLEGEAAHLRSANGEELRLREFVRDGAFQGVGFRHDFPDDEGRLWRTEAVVRRASRNDGQDLLRVRTECIALRLGARLEIPRKPYLIKMLLSDGWGGKDGELSVSDEPQWLEDDEGGLKVAQAVSIGTATQYLPTVYVSAIAGAKWLVSRDQISKIAFDLGGIAHVVVEPNRAFSFRLRDLTAGSNPYGGTIAIALPSRGIIRRLYLDFRFSDVEELLAATRASAVGIRSEMPAEGWDWTELQEQALRRQRERDRNRLSAEEAQKLYSEEIANLQDRIRQLEVQLAARAPGELADIDEGALPALLTDKLGPEVYPGEFSDRLRYAAKECSSRSDQIGLDGRSKAVFDAFVARVPLSPALSDLLDDLERATKEPKRVASELRNLLLRHGYRDKADNKHIRLEAENGYIGLDALTLPKTPSDHRGLTNLRKQVERTLGISKLSK